MSDTTLQEVPRVRPYDFRRPERTVGSVRQRLEDAHGRLAATIAQSVGDWAGAVCEVTRREVTEGEASLVLDEGAAYVAALPLVSGSGSIFFHLSGALAQGLVDRLLGGPGEARSVDRAPTAIERALLAPLAEAVRTALGTCGGTAPKTACYLDPDGRPAHRNTQGVSVRFELEVGPCTGDFHLFYPHEAVQEVLGIALGAERIAGSRASDQKITPGHLGSVRVRLRACLKPAPVQLRDLTSLRVGDVLRLDRNLTDEVLVRVGDQLVFLGYPGAVGGKIGVQISRTKDTRQSALS